LRFFDFREFGVPRCLPATGMYRLSRYDFGAFKQPIYLFSLAVISPLLFRLGDFAGKDVDIIEFIRREK
jgi:hypothetical protein